MCGHAKVIYFSQQRLFDYSNFTPRDNILYYHSYFISCIHAKVIYLSPQRLFDYNNFTPRDNILYRCSVYPYDDNIQH